MVKKDFIPVDDMLNDIPETEESKIEHINSLITDSDDKDEYVIKEEENVFKKEDDIEEDPRETPVKTESQTSEARKMFEKPKRHIDTPKKYAVKPEIKKYIVKKPEFRAKKPEMKPKIHKKPERMAYSSKNSGDKMKNHKKKSNTMWLWIGLALIVVIVIAFLLLKNNNVKPVISETTNEVAATVNGEPIYLKDINDQYDKLDPVSQKLYTKEAILNQTIDEVLLIQEAKNKNIQVAVQDINDELDNFKVQNQLTDQQLVEILKQQNITVDQLKTLIEKKLAVRNLLNTTILSYTNVGYTDILQYYNDNSDKFKQPEKVKAQHILILVNDTFNDSQAKQKIDMVNGLLSKTNFCELVTKYSDDPGSKTTCGTYTFGKGEFVPEFENASFSMKINETRIVKSVYGYHLIKKLEYISASIVPFEQVRDQINQSLHDLEIQKNFDKFLNELRTKAVIINYLNGQLTVNENSLIVTTNTNEQITPKNTTTTITTVTANLDDFAKCLTNKSAVFYGNRYIKTCDGQKEMFGNAFKYIKYVDCAVEGQPQVQTAECINADITGCPTWIIDEESYAGEQQLTDLARITGCELPE